MSSRKLSENSEKLQELADSLHITILVFPSGQMRTLRIGEAVPRDAEVYYGKASAEVSHGREPDGDPPAPAAD
jgi:hypothetical protein